MLKGKGSYSVANTHRMPKVAGHVSPKGPFGAKRATNYWAILPQREMTYEDKAPYASTPACIAQIIKTRSTAYV